MHSQDSVLYFSDAFFAILNYYLCKSDVLHLYEELPGFNVGHTDEGYFVDWLQD